MLYDVITGTFKEVLKLKNRAQDLILVILYISLGVVLSFLIVQNIENPWPEIVISSFLFISFSARNIFLYESAKYKKLTRLTILFDLLLVSLSMYIDKSDSSFIYFLIIISDAVLNDTTVHAIILSLGSYILYIACLLIKFNFYAPSIIPKAVFNSLAFIGIFGAAYVVKYFLRQNEFIDKTLKELTVKTLEQEKTYNELKEAYGKLQDITVLKERNKIAREIHDTVGHTLTTVLVEMEVGRKLAPKDMDQALEKFKMAQEQVRKGLNDLRNSVRMLEKGDEIMDFLPSIHSLINDTKKHAGVVIYSDIDIVSKLDDSLRRTLYHALQEGLTNGIRHGKSSAFVFKLIEQDGNILFSLEDNGIGCSIITPGFGLKSMKERVKEHSGSFKIELQPEGGFGLYIDIPIKA